MNKILLLASALNCLTNILLFSFSYPRSLFKFDFQIYDIYAKLQFYCRQKVPNPFQNKACISKKETPFSLSFDRILNKEFYEVKVQGSLISDGTIEIKDLTPLIKYAHAVSWRDRSIFLDEIPFIDRLASKIGQSGARLIISRMGNYKKKARYVGRLANP